MVFTDVDIFVVCQASLKKGRICFYVSFLKSTY